VVSKRVFSYTRIIRFSLLDVGLALIILAVIGFLPLGATPSVALAALLLLVLGIVLGIASSVLGAITQLSSDPKIEGPVLAYYASISLGAGAIGGLVEGFIADQLEIWWLPLASGVVVLIALLYLWSRHEFRALDEADPNHEHLQGHHAATTATVDSPYTNRGSSGGSRPRPNSSV